ncbi:unnamed protein product [Chilo suppressalis]|uniref:Ionotropic glutamate receptor C-terminal domain-containing protein n=1 Tax=Chilo suppressalis TaxID=168631 RepID=A0ABN8BD15_CHISP|nr:unnamed protein product [Chilo suppressalis]
MDVGYTMGVAAMTKVSAQLLNVLMQQHNFRFKYTIAGRWIGLPERNSTLAVSNSLYWREQDISCTSARMFPKWMETKFYYLIPNNGVGGYENQFLRPLSAGVWWWSCATLVVCAIVLAVAATLEGRQAPALYALFSVLAALCQQGRRVTVLVVGMTSMLLYNYYTSSVVSWLLNASVPSIDSLQGLMNSDLELVMMRLLERGHVSVSRARVGGVMPACSGRTPRALALGQAAPAFALLLEAALLALLILIVEIIQQRSVIRTLLTPMLSATCQRVQKVGQAAPAFALLLEAALLALLILIVEIIQQRSVIRTLLTPMLSATCQRVQVSRRWDKRRQHSLCCWRQRYWHYSFLSWRSYNKGKLTLGQAAPAFALLLEAALLALLILIVEIIQQRSVIRRLLTLTLAATCQRVQNVVNSHAGSNMPSCSGKLTLGQAAPALALLLEAALLALLILIVEIIQQREKEREDNRITARKEILLGNVPVILRSMVTLDGRSNRALINDAINRRYPEAALPAPAPASN